MRAYKVSAEEREVTEDVQSLGEDYLNDLQSWRACEPDEVKCGAMRLYANVYVKKGSKRSSVRYG